MLYFEFGSGQKTPTLSPALWGAPVGFYGLKLKNWNFQVQMETNSNSGLNARV